MPTYLLESLMKKTTYMPDFNGMRLSCSIIDINCLSLAQSLDIEIYARITLMNKAKCLQCKFYHVTWDMSSPKGCKAYGIKSKNFPSIIVKQASGEDCLKFEEKKKKNNTLDLNDKRLW